MNNICEKCGAQMNYTEGPDHLWKNSCFKCELTEEGTFSPEIDPYTGKFYSIYLEPINSLDNKQLLTLKEYVKTTDNLVQIKNKYSDGHSHELITQLQENITGSIVKRFNDVGLKVKVVTIEP